jgi:hypothetical protein
MRFELKDGRVLKIEQDETALDPRRDFDNVGTMVCMHKRYKLGDKHGYRCSDYNGWEAIIKQITDDNDKDICVMLPIFMYEHSGIALSCNTRGFSMQDSHGWDWGQLGVIYVTNEKAQKELGTTDKERVTQCLVSEVDLYHQYVSGEVYWFSLEKPVKCESCNHVEWEQLDSCGGFFGDNWKENGLWDHLPSDVVAEVWPKKEESCPTTK